MGSIDEIAASDGVERFDAASRAIPRNFDLLVRGWIADDSRKALARRVEATVDDRAVPVRYGFSRADVADATGIAELARSGFRIGIALDGFTRGRHVLRVYAEQATGERAVLDPVAFDVSEADVASASAAAQYALGVDAFGSDFPHPAGDGYVEQGNVLVMRGSIRDARSGNGAHAVFGIVDRFEAEPAQAGFSHPSGGHNGFLLCIPTLDLALGTHELHVVARSEAGSAQRFGPFAFTVTPVGCDLASPVASSDKAVAELAWVDAPALPLDVPRRVAASDVVHLRGWAVDPYGDAAGEAFLAFADGAQYAMLARQHRPDVALRSYGPKARFCGIVGSIAASGFAPGAHAGRLLVRAKNDQTYHATDVVVHLEVTGTR